MAAVWREINLFKPKERVQRRAHDLENQDAHEAPPRHGPTQGFNLLQISPNWFLGIWTLDPSKVGLRGPSFLFPFSKALWWVKFAKEVQTNELVVDLSRNSFLFHPCRVVVVVVVLGTKPNSPVFCRVIRNRTNPSWIFEKPSNNQQFSWKNP
jgi:hypothetical protein